MTTLELLTPALALDILYRALDQEIGYIVPIQPEDVKVVSNAIYAARREANDPRLNSLVLKIDQEAKTILIYKKGIDKLP